MSFLFSSPGATTFTVATFILQIVSLIFMSVLLAHFASLHRRRMEILSAFETPFISLRTMRFRVFFFLYILLTLLITIVSLILFSSLLRFL